MKLDVEVRDIEADRLVFSREMDVQITNSFTPQDLWIKSEDGRVEKKVQQYQERSFNYELEDDEYECHFAAYIVLSNQDGEMEPIILSPIFYKNGSRVYNLALKVDSAIVGITSKEGPVRFMLVDYSTYPGSKRK